MYMGPSPEELKRLEEEKEGEEWCADFFLRHPEVKISPEDLRECGPEIAEFQTLVSEFESKHSLEELHSIVDLTPELDALFTYSNDMSDEKIESTVKNFTPEYAIKYREKIAAIKNIVLSPEDAKIYKARIDAKNDLISIDKKINVLKEETDISTEKHKELKAEYARLSRAVENLKNNKVDHER